MEEKKCCMDMKPDKCDVSNTCDDVIDADMMCSSMKCGCVGYGYVPVQEMECLYELEKAIMSGTVFPELDLSIKEYGKICKKWGGAANE